MYKDVVIVGGGISGIIASLLVRKYAHKANITLIESQEKIGGLLQSYEYRSKYKFDIGTHYFVETGLQDVDECFEELLPRKERTIRTGFETDISGHYFNARLQLNTPCVDLRNHPKYDQYVAAFLSNFHHGISESCDSAYDYYASRYGDLITQEIIDPIVRKVFDQSLSNMSELGTRFLPLHRLCLFDEDLMKELILTQSLSSYLAYPNQRTLPKHKQPTFNSFYPKKIGVDKIINNFHTLAYVKNINILTDHKVTNIDYNGQSINSIIISKDNSSQSLDVDLMVSAAGLPPMYFLLGGPKLPFEPSHSNLCFINIIFKEPINIDDIYYLYVYDQPFSSMRITNYNNYCDDVGDGYPITIEYLNKDDQKDKDIILRKALSELRTMNLIDVHNVVLFSDIEFRRGFPTLTKNNLNKINDMRSYVANIELNNLLVTGALSSPEVYFQTEVIKDTYHKIKSFYEWQV
jgi:protoporphyrinogen oxidase